MTTAEPRHAPGTPCWVDLSVPDIDAAKAFYGAVLGWEFHSLGPEWGGWGICRAPDGAEVAAMGPGPADGDGERPVWNVYLATEDIDVSMQAAEAAGASVVLAAGQVGELGKAARFGAPGGGVCSLWQPGSHHGFEAMGPPGSPVWFELNTRQCADVAGFFAGLFAVEAQQMEMGGAEYRTLHAGGRPRYGVMQMTAEWGDLPAHWMTYFAVEDIDAALAAVAEHGGEVCNPPFDTPFGRMSVCTDPGGAVFTVIVPAQGG